MPFSSCAFQALHVSRAPSSGAVLAPWQVTPGLRSVAVVHTCYAWPSWPVAPVVFSILELMSNVLLCRPFDLISRHASLCQARRTTPRQGSRRLRRRDVVYSKDTVSDLSGDGRCIWMKDLSALHRDFYGKLTDEQIIPASVLDPGP